MAKVLRNGKWVEIATGPAAVKAAQARRADRLVAAKARLEELRVFLREAKPIRSRFDVAVSRFEEAIFNSEIDALLKEIKNLEGK